MNRYELKMILLSELTIEQVEDLFTELINDKIGVLISGRGEELENNAFENVHINKCYKIHDDSRPRCMFLKGDICKNVSGCIFD